MSAPPPLKYAELLAEVQAMRGAVDGRPYRVVILSNVTLSPLVGVLEWALLKEGIPPNVEVGEFDTIVQLSERLEDVDAAIIFWEAANLASDLPAMAEIFTEQRLDELAEGFAAAVDQALDNLRRVPLVLMNRFSALPFERHALRDGGLSHIVRRLNAALDARSDRNLVLVDVDKVYAMTGLGEALDFRQFHSAKALHTLAFLKQWVRHVLPAFRAATGRARKLLAVDLDNTLWGGVLGEDGEEAILMDDLTPAGAAFREAQLILKGWRREGVLLAILSKNNPEDVEHVLAHHPSMQLRDDDFVAKQVGWGEKIDGLRALAEELNLGLDSFVLLDDSPFELERVAQAAPEVAILRVPERLSDYPGMLRSARGLFFTLSTTDEDRARTEMYRAGAARRAAEGRHASVDEYIASLGLEVSVLEGRAVNVARAAQMTQKTNQFNLTTRRYTEGDIDRFVADPDTLVATFGVRDRFGDYGVTALAIARLDRDEATAHLDTLLMSCRVLGRKVELALMNWLAERLRRAGALQLTAEYLRTSKNAQVASLLPQLGFATVSDAPERSSYRLSLAAYAERPVPNIEVRA